MGGADGAKGGKGKPGKDRQGKKGKAKAYFAGDGDDQDGDDGTDLNCCARSNDETLLAASVTGDLWPVTSVYQTTTHCWQQEGCPPRQRLNLEPGPPTRGP